MALPAGFHAALIEGAHAQGDGKTVIKVYLDILDYERAGLRAEHILAVFKSLNYESYVDHSLVQQLGATGSKLGLLAKNANIKLHQALYYYKVKGYLSAVDLIKEAGSLLKGNSAVKLENSELLKQHLFAPLVADQQLDQDIKKQLVEAIKAIPTEKWEDRTFYGIEELLEDKKEETPAPVGEKAVEEA